MATFLYKTRGNSLPDYKPRVYFTCHPKDFTEHFENICEDIFITHDCAIYYTSDMNEEIEKKYLESDLGQMNLFVIPVTYKLLSESNRAMDSDFRYAKEKNIPVLPIMMESGLDPLYSLPNKFGELQYLSPYARDTTAISYAEKLNKYLESVLISNEMAERIRKAFDAYIFLSYRKKDRHHANELMKIIHGHKEFRDIAIWYDEFLTPGESFRENIKKMITGSKLFALLITPHILEYVDGQPNYVMSHEYPDAKTAGMDILPVEMETTDRNKLHAKFENIPDCIKSEDETNLKDRLLNSLSNIMLSENNDDPEHNFLIGLAYLDGIDVEKNIERGIHLITLAAESGLIEAIEKLYLIYRDGLGVQPDYQKTVQWAKRIVKYNKNKYGSDHTTTLVALNNLYYAYYKAGDMQNAWDCINKVYPYVSKILDKKDPLTIATINNLALAYSQQGEYKIALELYEQAFSLSKEIFGEEDPYTVIILKNYASVCDEFGNYKRSFKLTKDAYSLACRVWGEENPNTFSILSDLADCYRKMGEIDRALDLQLKIYDSRYKLFGDKHPDTLDSLLSIAITYSLQRNKQKALELMETVYSIRCEILGEEHPNTLSTLASISAVYAELGNHDKSLELGEKVYARQCQILGEDHPDAIHSLRNLSIANIDVKNYRKSLEQANKVYEITCARVDENHPELLNILDGLISLHYHLNHFDDVSELIKKLSSSYVRIYGRFHPKTLKKKAKLFITAIANSTSRVWYKYYDSHNFFGKTPLQVNIIELQYKFVCHYYGNDDPLTLKKMKLLAYSYYTINDYSKALELFEKHYALSCDILGNLHPQTINSLSNIAAIYYNLENYQTALEWYKKLYKNNRSILGEEHPDTLAALTNLSNCYIKLNDYQSYVKYARKLYAIQVRILGEIHEETITILHNLGMSYKKVENYDRALKTLEKAYNLRCTVLGEDHPSTISTKESLDHLKFLMKCS